MKDELVHANSRVQDNDVQIATLKQQLEEERDSLKKSRSELLNAEGQCDQIKREHASCAPEVQIMFHSCSLAHV